MAGKRKAPGGGAGATKRRRGGDHAGGNATEKLYSLTDEILVLGDGDFTFSKGLVTHRGGGRNLLATSYDSETKVKAKYSNAAECIKDVRGAGAHVLHCVDATKLHLLPRRANETRAKIPPFFKYIIFNFPHTGQQRVHINRALLLEFFESARAKLLKAGEVHITLKNRPPYSNWLVEDQAKTAGFVLKERRKFNIRNFPGYHHRTTDPQAKAFEAELCTTYVFIVNRSKYPFEAIVAAQREKERQPEPQIEEEETHSDDARSDQVVREDADELVAETMRSTTKTSTHRKRSKRFPKPASGILPPVAVLANVSRREAVNRKTRFALWRPLHMRR